MPVPAWAVRLGLGDFSQVILGSVRAVPRRLADSGFTHVHPDIGSAALLFTQEILVESPRLRQAGEAAIADGTLDAEEVATAIAAQQEAAGQGWAFSAVTVFAFALQKGP